MKFTPMKLEGAFLIDMEPVRDSRGYFSRHYCASEFEKHVRFSVSQCNISFNEKCGTLRGMHYQSAPFEEAKAVTCIQGAIFDVIVDIRKGSPTFGQWEAVELSESTFRTIFVPEGFAHGYQTLTENAAIYYQVSAPYSAQHSCGIHFADPDLSIPWPINNPTVSDRDKKCPRLYEIL